MSKWVEWDFDHPRNRPRVEILPPDERHIRVRITIERRRPNWLPLLIVALVLFVIWRAPLGLVMLGALMG